MVTWKEIRDNPRSRERIEKKSDIIKYIREFFWLQNFIEPTTPIAVNKMIQEKHLNFLPVKFHNPKGEEFSFFLVTSPEIGLKKMLAGGFEKIFQITPVFRDYEDFGHTHNTEFLMLEWYRSPGGLQEIMDDTEKLVKFISEKIDVKSISFKGKTVDLTSVWERISMKDLWQKYLQVDLDNYVTTKKMVDLARSLGLTVEEGEEYEDVFYKIFLNKVEPYLGWERPVMIFDYPVPMAALCRVNPNNQNYVERAEVYIAGIELSNAYGELVDKKEQENRMKENYNFRRNNGLVLSPIDDDLNEAIGNIKSAGGIALGVDRLVMLLTGADNINEVIFESVSDQVER